jgi:predicted  nucleic acid-binding Zn-ribbon protein
MTSDPPELGKGLFGYRRSAVNQILSDRDLMLRQAEGRVRAAESKVADLEGELQGIRTRNARMDEQLERLRTQLDALTKRSEASMPGPAQPAGWDESSDADLIDSEGYGDEPPPALGLAGEPEESFEEGPALTYDYGMNDDEPIGEPEASRAEAYRATNAVEDQEAGPDAYMETAPEYREPMVEYPAEPALEPAEGAESSEPFSYPQHAFSYGEEPAAEAEPASDLDAFSYAPDGDVAYVGDEAPYVPEGSTEAETYREEPAVYDVPAYEAPPEPSAFGPEIAPAPQVEYSPPERVDYPAAESAERAQGPRAHEAPPAAVAPPPVSPEASDSTSRMITEEIAGVLSAAEESASRILERARVEADQQSAQSHRLWEEVQAEVARLASWREGVDPVIRTVLTKVEGIRARIEEMPERIREALAPMADSISGIDGDLAELAEACSPPLLLTPNALEPEGEGPQDWESEGRQSGHLNAG